MPIAREDHKSTKAEYPIASSSNIGAQLAALNLHQGFPTLDAFPMKSSKIEFGLSLPIPSKLLKVGTKFGYHQSKPDKKALDAFVQMNQDITLTRERAFAEVMKVRI